MATVLKTYEGNQAKITVEEISCDRYITTYWDKTSSTEADRQVFKFETYGGALGKALDLSIDILMSMDGSWEEV